MTIAEPPPFVQANDREDRAEKLADLSTMIGLGPDDPQILDLVKYAGDPPEYWMDTSGGSITLGSVANIINQTKFIEGVAAVTSIVFVRIPAPAWAKRAEAILSCCRVVELGNGSHPAIETSHWIEDYLDTQTILDDPDIAAQQGLPFRRDGVVFFTLGGFKNHLRFNVGEPLSSKKLGTRFRLSDVNSERVYFPTKEGSQTSRNYWAYRRG